MKTIIVPQLYENNTESIFIFKKTNSLLNDFAGPVQW